ncbi:MAG TPA: 2-oxo-4-hydroxy-4-carboxy-5-ureidoimidazoline decarboxylase [Candidatus Eisenbacteria bacterium]|nr:2-oxo-4-hydroxy-4-carboxy-5-ureidoimidazoline decarboxylase [Candidatus Eisenbacteria bacterium]
MRIESLNALPDDAARAGLARCCGASRWVGAMLAARPYADRDALFAAAERAADALGPDDWRQAFAHHPRIGDRAALERRFASTTAWAADEQRGAATAAPGTLDALAEGNRAYEARFGYVFIVCATGLGAREMLSRLNARLCNDPERELAIAADEQRKITRLRLAKLLEEE